MFIVYPIASAVLEILTSLPIRILLSAFVVSVVRPLPIDTILAARFAVGVLIVAPIDRLFAP